MNIPIYFAYWILGIISLQDDEGFTRIPGDLSKRTLITTKLQEPPILLWFVIQLLDLIDWSYTTNPNIMEYFKFNKYFKGVIEIGLVRRSDPKI